MEGKILIWLLGSCKKNLKSYEDGERMSGGGQFTQEDWGKRGKKHPPEKEELIQIALEEEGQVQR